MMPFSWFCWLYCDCEGGHPCLQETHTQVSRGDGPLVWQLTLRSLRKKRISLASSPIFSSCDCFKPKLELKQVRDDCARGWHLQFLPCLPCFPPSVACVSCNWMCHFLIYFSRTTFCVCITETAKGRSDVLIDVPIFALAFSHASQNQRSRWDWYLPFTYQRNSNVNVIF